MRWNLQNKIFLVALTLQCLLVFVLFSINQMSLQKQAEWVSEKQDGRWYKQRVEQGLKGIDQWMSHWKEKEHVSPSDISSFVKYRGVYSKVKGRLNFNWLQDADGMPRDSKPLKTSIGKALLKASQGLNLGVIRVAKKPYILFVRGRATQGQIAILKPEVFNAWLEGFYRPSEKVLLVDKNLHILFSSEQDEVAVSAQHIEWVKRWNEQGRLIGRQANFYAHKLTANSVSVLYRYPRFLQTGIHYWWGICLMALFLSLVALYWGLKICWVPVQKEAAAWGIALLRVSEGDEEVALPRLKKNSLFLFLKPVKKLQRLLQEREAERLEPVNEPETESHIQDTKQENEDVFEDEVEMKEFDGEIPTVIEDMAEENTQIPIILSENTEEADIVEEMIDENAKKSEKTKSEKIKSVSRQKRNYDFFVRKPKLKEDD